MYVWKRKTKRRRTEENTHRVISINAPLYNNRKRKKQRKIGTQTIQ